MTPVYNNLADEIWVYHRGMAPTYITALATLLVGIAAIWGKVIPIDTAQALITAIVFIAGPLIVMARQLWTGRSTIVGSRPN